MLAHNHIFDKDDPHVVAPSRLQRRPIRPRGLASLLLVVVERLGRGAILTLGLICWHPSRIHETIDLVDVILLPPPILVDVLLLLRPVWW